MRAAAGRCVVTENRHWKFHRELDLDDEGGEPDGELAGGRECHHLGFACVERDALLLAAETVKEVAVQEGGAARIGLPRLHTAVIGPTK